MYLVSVIIFSFFLLNTARFQTYHCSCSCCLGQGCSASQLSEIVYAQHCTDASCLEACKARYYQCNVLTQYGQAFGKCLKATTPITMSTTAHSISIGGPYLCRCNCCNTGSYLCTPVFVGSTNAFSCYVSTCSIACTQQYPNVCVNNQFGQTQGTCVGMSTSTPTTPNGSLRCGCICYGPIGSHNYEVITTNGCASCFSACQSIQLQCSAHQNTYCIT